jgi:protein SCO1
MSTKPSRAGPRGQSAIGAALARRMKRTLALLATSLLAAASAVSGELATLKSGVFDPARVAPAFTLQGSDGSALDLARFRGKVVLLGFGFTSCTEVCPITLLTLAQARKQLGPQAGELQVVYVTVDPERDDAARMKEYLGKFDSSFIGGTGTADALAAVRREYGIAAAKQAGRDGAYTHSSFVYLIDREGRLRALMPYGRPSEDYVHDLRILLAAP